MPFWSVGWTPPFLLKRYVLTGILEGPHEPFVVDSVDFIVAQVEMLSREDMASRLTLTTDAASVGPMLLSDSFITLMDNSTDIPQFHNSSFLKTNDKCSTPQLLIDQVSERCPGARRADMKSGGDFPFLSRPDELHLRRVGVEAREDIVPRIPKDEPSGGSSSEQNKRQRRPQRFSK